MIKRLKVRFVDPDTRRSIEDLDEIHVYISRLTSELTAYIVVDRDHYTLETKEVEIQIVPNE